MGIRLLFARENHKQMLQEKKKSKILSKAEYFNVALHISKDYHLVDEAY